MRLSSPSELRDSCVTSRGSNKGSNKEESAQYSMSMEADSNCSSEAHTAVCPSPASVVLEIS